MNVKIRVGLIGRGSISGSHAGAYKQWADMAQVVATCDVDEAKAKARAQALGAQACYGSIGNLLKHEGLDAVGEILNSLAIQGVKGARHWMSVHGEKASLVAEASKVELRLPGAPEPVVHAHECAGPNGIAEEIRQFLTALREKKPMPVTGEDGYLALEACMAAYQSAAKGKVVKLGRRPAPIRS